MFQLQLCFRLKNRVKLQMDSVEMCYFRGNKISLFRTVLCVAIVDEGKSHPKRFKHKNLKLRFDLSIKHKSVNLDGDQKASDYKDLMRNKKINLLGGL